jgi:hypothetical protein
VSARNLVASLAGVLAAGLLLVGCGGSDEVATTHSVAQRDVAVGVDVSWASCAPVSSSEPNSRPGRGFFSDDAPDDGELVPGQPVAAVLCASYPSTHVAGGTDLALTGSSLDGLVNALNHVPRYEGHYHCTSQAGTSRRVVFRYDDGPLLPVLLSTDSCGWAGRTTASSCGTA